jgi:hypothetical protein
METRLLLSTFVVNTVSDLDRAGGLPLSQESLRQAIEDVNADTGTGADTINFNIPGSGVQLIQPLSQLPTITAHPVLIDGYTQPGASPDTNDPTLGDNAVLLVELDGSQAGPSASGLTLLASDSTIRGLVINRFSNNGIVINGPTAARDVIAGNFIGTDPSGTLARSNGVDPLTTSGIWVQNAANNTIGGPAAADRNLISGNTGCGVTILINSSGNLVAGNFIGTTAAGDSPLGNGQWGVSFGNYTYYQCCGDHNTIGGNAAGMKNLISGNTAGIALFHETDDLIAGNFMGTDPTGMHPVPQGWAIWLNACQGVTVGGTTPEARNLMAFGGMDISDGTGDSVVQGNDFGTDVTGQNALGQCLHAIMLESGAHHITIGGNVAGAKNVLTGSTSWAILSEASCHDVVIAGNFIGTNAAGTAALPTHGGVYIITNPGGGGGSDEYNIRVGTDGDGVGDDLERNIISGTLESGITIAGGEGNYVRDVLVAGNYIGLGADGKTAIPNVVNGVNIEALVSGIVIGGVTPAMRNVISGNIAVGVDIVNTSAGSAVLGNFIGTSADGTTLIPNGAGVRLTNSSDNTIGGSSMSGAGNLISQGVLVRAGSSRNLFAGNTIGPLGDNGYDNLPRFGVYVEDSSFNTIGGVAPGAGNLIRVIQGSGVTLVGQSAGNQVRGNAIYENGGIGIDLGGDGVTRNGTHAPGEQGPNNWQQFPVLSTTQGGPSTTVTGTLAGTVGASYWLDFYANATPDPSGYGEGQVYLGSKAVTVADSSGSVSFTATGLAPASPGQWISATATDPAGNTSEFSSDVQAVQANTVTSVTSSENPALFGQSVAFTASVAPVTPASGVPTGTVTFYDNGTAIGTGWLNVVSGQDDAVFSTSALSTTTHAITASFTSGDGNFNSSPMSAAISQVVNKDGTTTTVSASPMFANVAQTVTFTAGVSANSPGSGAPGGTVDFYDTTTSTDLTPGGVALSSGTASFATTSLAAGPHTITATYSGDPNFLTSYGSTGTVTIGQTIFVLDPSAGGALSLSGNASIKVGGGVYVDSSSSSAISASGNATVKASVIDVRGGVSRSGNASFSPAPVTGAASAADPLGSLAQPSTSGLTTQGSVSLSGNSSKTIPQGIYSSISVSGNASLTLSGGTYIIKGGGFSVSGNGSISGSGVLIVNAGSQYPSAGGTYGSVTLSGNGSYNLTPQNAGIYAGIVIWQSRDNGKAITISGNASGMTGTIYAPAALMAESGNASLNAAIIADTMTISGNGVANALSLTSPSGTAAYSPAQILATYGISGLGDGSGQTIAIVDAYDDPGIYQSVDAFDSQFGLTASATTLYSQCGPASSFLTVLNQEGQATSLPTTDLNGPGAANWELEEALDVEWAHAVAPGAQIILVEADSQALSDLIAGVAAAARQPGVSIVSMSWGFPEGQAVFAGDEATYDSYFNVPGVTFVASTGDYGAADPEYPAFSPDVVAVGGTSLALNADGSYNSETGWGYYSASAGALIGSGGGISLYENEPAFQQAVQSTGSRTTPDVSLVADPATGAWIADAYNLDPSNPFQVVGGTSLSAPAWAGLLALVNQGRVAAGESTLNSSTPTDAQRALYMLPQSAYNVIASGSNGYSAASGYNLVTGLGTPVASVLVPDLIAYQGAATAYSGATVAPLSSSGLINSASSDSGTTEVFSVFDSFAVRGAASGGAGSSDVHVPRAASAGVRHAAVSNKPAIAAVDQVLRTLQDETPREVLIGDLAFELAPSGARKPRGASPI